MLRKIEEKVYSNTRISADEALYLYQADDIFSLAKMASHVRKIKNNENAYFVSNRHINPTNICVNRCKFCAFSRSKGEDGAYELSIEQIVKKLKPRSSNHRLFSEVHIVGGLHPDWPFQYYLDLLKAIKIEFPSIAIKAFTAVEIDYLSKISGLSIEDTISQLKKSGLDLMPGGGAEIFDTSIRNALCPEKISGEKWLSIMEAAHNAGIKANSTMLYGHIEKNEHRIDHLLKLRDLQDRTSGFQAFIPLKYHPQNTDVGGPGSSGIDDLRTIAISRIFLDNFDHIKAYWIMLGEKVSQIALMFGADDLDGTVIEEKITHSAGATSKEGMTRQELVHMITRAGRTAVERDAYYNQIKVYGRQ
ncbi:MAG: aminofutalosine synthase MqnE [Dissulfurispiraceae bacterium]|jgi:aminodeoxyfutalosine synthase|nr:aminofutalosine synthase MqnE [Dissulfurispiraceae bacterium]